MLVRLKMRREFVLLASMTILLPPSIVIGEVILVRLALLISIVPETLKLIVSAPEPAVQLVVPAELLLAEVIASRRVHTPSLAAVLFKLLTVMVAA